MNLRANILCPGFSAKILLYFALKVNEIGISELKNTCNAGVLIIILY